MKVTGLFAFRPPGVVPVGTMTLDKQQCYSVCSFSRRTAYLVSSLESSSTRHDAHFVN